MNTQIMLVTKDPDDKWIDRLINALDEATLELLVVDADLFWGDYKEIVPPVVLVDSTSVTESEAVVRAILGQQQEVRIVVITSAPNWRQAREVLRAGAAKYLYKTNDLERFVMEIDAVLAQSPPKISQEYLREGG